MSGAADTRKLFTFKERLDGFQGSLITCDQPGEDLPGIDGFVVENVGDNTRFTAPGVMKIQGFRYLLFMKVFFVFVAGETAVSADGFGLFLLGVEEKITDLIVCLIVYLFVFLLL